MSVIYNIVGGRVSYALVCIQKFNEHFCENIIVCEHVIGLYVSLLCEILYMCECDHRFIIYVEVLYVLFECDTYRVRKTWY